MSLPSQFGSLGLLMVRRGWRRLKRGSSRRRRTTYSISSPLPVSVVLLTDVACGSDTYKLLWTHLWLLLKSCEDTCYSAHSGLSYFKPSVAWLLLRWCLYTGSSNCKKFGQCVFDWPAYSPHLSVPFKAPLPFCFCDFVQV